MERPALLPYQIDIIVKQKNQVILPEQSTLADGQCRGEATFRRGRFQIGPEVPLAFVDRPAQKLFQFLLEAYLLLLNLPLLLGEQLIQLPLLILDFLPLFGGSIFQEILEFLPLLGDPLVELSLLSCGVLQFRLNDLVLHISANTALGWHGSINANPAAFQIVEVINAFHGTAYASDVLLINVHRQAVVFHSGDDCGVVSDGVC